MSSRLHLVRAASAAAALLLALPTTAHSETTAPTPGAAPPAAVDLAPGLLDAMQRDLGLSRADALRRITAEAAAPVVEQQLRRSLGAAFAGAWFAPGSARLQVAVTDRAKARAVRTAGAEPVVVERTARTLETARAALDRRAAVAGKAIHAWYVDVASNSVVVIADRSATAAAARFVRDSGVATGTARVVASGDGAPRPLYDTRGGDQYVINGNVLCSIGFAVTGGFVTAGHCGGVGASTSGSGVAQGTFRGSSFPGNDYGWVQTNSSWVSRPWVNNYAGGVVGVAGSQEAAIGSSICRSGRTTGWRCGTIEAKNVTVNYSVGAVYGMTQTNACAEGGDSGGSWLTGNQAQGVTSGGSGNCTTGGRTFFQPLGEILAVYGLQLTTTTASTSRIIGLNNRCIDVPGGNPADGTQLQIWDCNGTAAQAWTFASDGTIRAFGKCMDVAWGSTVSGTIIQIVGCNGNPAQQFRLTSAGDLVNPQANKCVDVKDWNGNNGGKLILWDCHGGANQKWRRG